MNRCHPRPSPGSPRAGTKENPPPRSGQHGPRSSQVLPPKAAQSPCLDQAAGRAEGWEACLPLAPPRGTERSPHCPTDTALDPHFGVPLPGLTDQLRGLCKSPLRSAPELHPHLGPAPHSAVWESPSAERKCHPGHPSPRGLLQRMDQAVGRGPEAPAQLGDQPPCAPGRWPSQVRQEA